MQDLAGKVLFITGGASGIGLGIASVLVDAGMNAVIADLRPDHIEEALREFEHRGQRARVHAIELDVTDRAAMARAADETERVFGKVHVLANNAGVDCSGPPKQATYADWDFGLGVNLGGVVNGVQTFLPRILRHGEGGHIVSTASMAGLIHPSAGMIIYAPAKAAVIAYMESLRLALAGDRIGVSVLCPGPFKSKLHESGQNRPARFREGSGFAAREAALANRPISERWADPRMAGEKVLKAIRENALYVLTHGEWRAQVQERTDAILAAMPTEIDEELLASVRSNPRPAKG